MLKSDRPAPQGADGWVVQAAVETHFASPSIWCILPIMDLLGMDESLRRKNAKDERINVPEDSMHYWR